MKKILLIVSLLVFLNTAYAQPHFSDVQGNLQYRDYELLINPAVLGGADRYMIALGLNKQWTGIQDSPLSEVVQFQMPLAQNSGLGAWVYNESYGPQNNTQFAAAYSYKLKLKENTLSFGLNLSLLMMNEKQVTGINDPADPVFASAMGSQIGFNAGFGAYYFGDKFYAGFSIPQLLTNDIDGSKLKNSLDFGRMQYYFTGGYRFDLSEKISLTPTALVAVSGATDFGYEVMAFAAYMRRYEIGAGIAAHSALRLTAGVAITENIAVRYQYAQNLGENYNNIGGSHFVVLRFMWK